MPPVDTDKHAVEIIGREICYDGFFKLERYRLRHTLFAGGWSGTVVREILERGHAVAVLPYDPVSDCVVFIEQFRVGALHTEEGAWLLEIIAGMIEEGESREEVARREMAEESGCEIMGELIPLYDYHVSAGGTSERITLYCGQVDASNAGGIFGLDEESEDIKVHVFSYAEAMALLEQGKIRSATPIIALQWLALKRDELKARWL